MIERFYLKNMSFCNVIKKKKKKILHYSHKHAKKDNKMSKFITTADMFLTRFEEALTLLAEKIL